MVVELVEMLKLFVCMVVKIDFMWIEFLVEYVM